MIDTGRRTTGGIAEDRPAGAIADILHQSEGVEGDPICGNRLRNAPAAQVDHAPEDLGPSASDRFYHLARNYFLRNTAADSQRTHMHRAPVLRVAVPPPICPRKFSWRKGGLLQPATIGAVLAQTGIQHNPHRDMRFQRSTARTTLALEKALRKWSAWEGGVPF